MVQFVETGEKEKGGGEGRLNAHDIQWAGKQSSPALLYYLSMPYISFILEKAPA